MRLALITHRFVKGEGQGRVNYELARAALADGHTVWLLASDVAPELAAHPRARVVRLSVAGVPSALLQEQLFALKSARWLWQHHRELDLVHANGFVSWARADVNTSHFVHAAWRRSPFYAWRARRGAYALYQRLYSVAGSWLERCSYRSARCVVAVSEQVRRELLDTGLAPGRVRTIPNGVDPGEFRPGTVSREALGLPSGKLVLFVGDIKTSRKNLDTLLQAMRGVTDATLIVAGEVAGSPFPRLASQSGLDRRVAFLGFRRDIARIMQAVDLFVFPSRYEACSLVLLEAAASGLPVVTTCAAGGVELLSTGCSRRVTNPEDPLELARVLNSLLADPAELARMGREARRIALENSWEIMAQRYLNLYRELLGEWQPDAVLGARP